MRVPIAVRAVTGIAEKVWWTPPFVRSVSLEGVLEEERFEPISVEWSDRTLHGFQIGSGPAVVLVHGWGGQAAQMAPLAAAIADSGFRAVALDLPGHGVDRRPRSDAFQMASAVRALVDSLGGAAGVVAHSLGSVATLVAFDDGMPARIVLVAPVLDIEHAVTVFVSRAQLFPWTADRLRSRFKDFVGSDWWTKLTRGSDTDLGDADLLVVHDVGDRETPFDVSAALAEKHPRAEFLATTGLGHSRVLADPSVSRSVAEFLDAAATHSEFAEAVSNRGH